MTHDQLLVLSIIGGAILALVAAAFLLLFQERMSRSLLGGSTGCARARP